ncbi:MAG: argininosuccinate synthase, partial [Candidatus Micrarchaeota archaeon]
IAPIRDWELFRDEEIEYAMERKLPMNVTKKKPYSIDQNIWGRSIECGVLEHPEVEPPEDAFEWTVSPSKAPDKPTYVEIEFEKGIPVEMKVMDERKKVKEVARGVKLIERLNGIAGENGVGRIDHMEDRVVGLKTREVYECPGAVVLLTAHKDLEKYVLTKDELNVKGYLDNVWSEIVYSGKWFSPLREELDAFMDKSQEVVSGRVLMKLYKGSAAPAGRESRNALYDLKKATYDKGTTWSQREGGVYSKLFGAQSNAAYHIRHRGK